MPTIALVDDDRNILASVSMTLESEGYRVNTYNDGATALDGLAQLPPDLAILDIKMPRMDGMELLRKLRQKSDLPVIFLTSKDDEIDELFGLKMGADDFIKKPFSQRLLLERIRTILRRHAAVEAASDEPKPQDATLVRGDLTLEFLCKQRGVEFRGNRWITGVSNHFRQLPLREAIEHPLQRMRDHRPVPIVPLVPIAWSVVVVGVLVETVERE